MTLNERLRAALAGVGVPAVPDVYTGKKSTYITFNYDLIPAQFADDRPLHQRALIQVHYVCPLEESSTAARRGIRQSLVDAGFSWPEAVNATDGDGQHYVFETEAVIGWEEV